MKIKANREKTKELTDRERNIIKYIAHGWKDEEISKEVGCAMGTLRQSVSKILEKTNVSNRPSLIFYACKNGLV